MKQDVGGLDGRSSGIKVFHVRVLDDDLSTGGRVSHLGFRGDNELALRSRHTQRKGRVPPTYSTFALGPLLGSSDGILLVRVHLIHHLLFLKLPLRLFFPGSLMLVRRLRICSLAFPLVALSRGLLRRAISIDSSIVSFHRLTVVLSSTLFFGLSVLSSSDSFQLLCILGSFLIVSGLFGLVTLNRWRGVVVCITLPVDPRRRSCDMDAMLSQTLCEDELDLMTTHPRAMREVRVHENETS
jgi:hypothetical protein